MTLLQLGHLTSSFSKF